MMKSLTVTLDYSYTEYTPDGGPPASRLALPLRVLDAEGGLIAEGVTSGSHPAVFSVPETDDPLFVRLTWPSGKTETKKVSSDSVRFGDERIGRNEWSAWAVPRLNKNTLLARLEPVSPEVGIDSFKRVWLRLWQFKSGKWLEVSIAPTAKNRNAVAVQLDFKLEQGAWCLQLGGSKVPWRMVSLPGGGPCRVLITPNASTDPRAELLTVAVTGFRRDAETLLEFLSRDSLRAANAVAGFEPLAVQLLQKKFDDPISAVAGAYFLLRTQGWSSVPARWFDNLTNEFPWLPDAPIVRCVVLLRSGLSSNSDLATARELLAECLNRGVPIFAEGLSLLQEAASVLHRRSDRVKKLAASQAWAGAAFSYYGEDPSSPSPVEVFGTPTADRTTGRKRKGTRIARDTRPAEQQVIFLEQI